MMKYEGENIRLRPTEESDLDFVVRAEMNSENSKFILPWSIDQHITSFSDPDFAHFIIECRESGRTLGFIILAGLQKNKSNLEFKRIVITEKGNGYGRESVSLIKEIAFKHLNAERLWLDVVEHNERARKLYLSEGFIEESILENYELNKEIVNLVIMAICKADYN